MEALTIAKSLLFVTSVEWKGIVHMLSDNMLALRKPSVHAMKLFLKITRTPSNSASIVATEKDFFRSLLNYRTASCLVSEF